MNTNIGAIISNAAVNSSHVIVPFNIYQNKKVDKPQPNLSDHEKLIVKNWQATNVGTKGENLEHRSRVSTLIINFIGSCKSASEW
jgi:23S rRNA C2498 (ribose-2'-O)-methylase RlmM